MESLRLQQRMNARYGTQGQEPVSMFRRLEDRINDMELEAKSLRDLRRIGTEFLTETGQRVQSVVERELEQLKRKLEKEGWSSSS
jgi:phage shock protein A